MSRDVNGTDTLAVPEQPKRRTFVKRAALAALGVSAAGPIAGARAQTTGSPAYTDQSNTFTAPQTFDARVGVTTNDSSTWQPSLAISRQDTGGFACSISSMTTALAVGQAQDLQGQQWDTLDVFHKGTGDGLYVDHKGGIPPGYTGPTSGIAGVNVEIPYYLDAGGTGREGTVVNNRTGMRGLFLNVQTPNNNVIALEINHWTNSYAQYIKVQAPGYPQGTGGGIGMEDYSPASSLKIDKWTAPNAGEGIIVLQGFTSSPIPALRISDNSTAVRALVRTDGTAAFGTGSPFAVRLQAEMGSAGIARNLALTNAIGGQGAGVQIEFDDRSAQYAQIAGVFDVTTGPRSGSLRFNVLSSDSMVERLRLSGSGIGFFGATPVQKPTATGSRAGNSALASLVSALAGLGLLSDSTTT